MLQLKTKFKHRLRVGRVQVTSLGPATDCNFPFCFGDEEVGDRTLGREEDGSGEDQEGWGLGCLIRGYIQVRSA